MPWVTIQWFKGRDAETKKRVMEAVTRAVCDSCGVSADAVSVVFKDIEKSDWANNGVFYSEK